MSEHLRNSAAVLHAMATDLVVEERPVPSPGPGEILISNRAIAVNPIDWKRQAWGFLIPSYPVVLGADISGVVAGVGPSVEGFKVGDRVIGMAHAFLSGNADNAAYQKYTVTKAVSSGKIPPTISFQEAATLPTALASASVALFDVLGLPLPSDGASRSSASILVWGGASSVGSMTIQLARLAGLVVIATASEKHHAYLRSIGASVLVDYSSSTATNDVVAAAEGAGMKIAFAVDTVSTPQTLAQTLEVLSKSPAESKRLAHLVPQPKESNLAVPDDTTIQWVDGEAVWERRADLSTWLYNESLAGWLESGEVVPGRYRRVEGGLGGLQHALNQLKQGVSGEKLLVEV